MARAHGPIRQAIAHAREAGRLRGLGLSWASIAKSMHLSAETCEAYQRRHPDEYNEGLLEGSTEVERSLLPMALAAQQKLLDSAATEPRVLASVAADVRAEVGRQQDRAARNEPLLIQVVEKLLPAKVDAAVAAVRALVPAELADGCESAIRSAFAG